MKTTATTVGLGPFQPAIKVGQSTFVHLDTYENEEDAYMVAARIAAVACEAYLSVVQQGGFMRYVTLQSSEDKS